MAKGWYVLHVYSGYEKRVEEAINNLIQEKVLEGILYQIKVPVKDVTNVRNGKKMVQKKKVFPGYVLLEMDIDKHRWREIYTKIDDEMSYDTYFLEIDNYFPTIDNNNIIVRSIKKDGLNLIVLRENKTNLISLKLENGFMSFADGTRVFLTFDKDGNIVIRQNSIALPPIGPYQNALIEIGVKNSSIPSKKIKIDSDMISGSVVIE